MNLKPRTSFKTSITNMNIHLGALSLRPKLLVMVSHNNMCGDMFHPSQPTKFNLIFNFTKRFLSLCIRAKELFLLLVVTPRNYCFIVKNQLELIEPSATTRIIYCLYPTSLLNLSNWLAWTFITMKKSKKINMTKRQRDKVVKTWSFVTVKTWSKDSAQKGRERQRTEPMKILH